MKKLGSFFLSTLSINYKLLNFMKSNSQFLVAAISALLASMLLSACAVNPATGGANLVLMSENREKEIGLEEHEKVMTSMPLFEEEELVSYVERIGQKMADVSHRPDLVYHFFVIDSPEINAFALPGGYVYVNRGLLTYMNDEADLAAVLAHEIGHITARHAVQQQARGAFARGAAVAGGIVAGIATGSGYAASQISEVASIWAQTGLSGFGREHELEADSLAAEYLVNAGYDPAAMIEVITVLKNQEDFNRRVTGGGGTYHGLFATHPRNDRRLQEAIAQVGQLEESATPEADNDLFREIMNGLIVGQSNASQRTDQRNRYYQDLLGYTLVFPDDWNIEETTTTVTASAPNAGNIRIEAQRLQGNIEPRVFIRDNMGIENLQKSEPLSQFRLIGHTGVAPNSATGKMERVATLYLGPRAFTFRGEITDISMSDEIDEMLLASIRSFRAIQQGEVVAGSEMKIKYVQASEFFDFSVVAQQSKIANFPEETLRLLNGYYPTGSPEEGDWIKLVE
ncbi:MAG: M48 family metalloprotease [Pseudomonadales bacterium]|nr:M48 family metalloprotease [Pseudomonadales bacterium]